MAALFSACPDVGSIISGPKLAESVTLSETAISLAAGETRQLSATVEPQDAENKALIWVSTAPAFATVSDSGLVTAVAVGATVVTATTRDGSNKVAACMVTVTPPPVKVTSITVTPATPTIERGSTVQLNAAVLPADATDKTVTWSSGNQAVATVNSAGLVSGITASNTPVTITATANDGSGVSGTATVTVTLPADITVPVTSITATPSSIPSPFYPGNTFTISTTLVPGSPSDPTVSWSASPAGIVSLSANTGSSITVTAAGPGTATITAAATGGVDITDTVQVTVTPSPSGGPTLTITSSFSGTVYPGNKIPISAAIYPEETYAYLSWSSGNQSVATVSGAGSYNLNAVITAVAPGTATITASNQYNSELSGTYTVTVSQVPVSSVSLDKISRELSPGGTFSLTAAVAPDNAADKAVSWSVQPAGIVTLSSTTGSSITITATTTGTATITASSGGKTATCAVSVKAGSGIGIDFAGFGGEAIDLTPNHANDLSRWNYDELTVTLSGSYDYTWWYVDGQNWWNSGSSHTINASGLFVGVHYLTVVVQTSDSKYFSKELSFRVVE
jgi:uncharacterized protein YjdB